MNACAGFCDQCNIAHAQKINAPGKRPERAAFTRNISVSLFQLASVRWSERLVVQRSRMIVFHLLAFCFRIFPFRFGYFRSAYVTIVRGAFASVPFGAWAHSEYNCHWKYCRKHFDLAVHGVSFWLMQQRWITAQWCALPMRSIFQLTHSGDGLRKESVIHSKARDLYFVLKT